MLGSDVLEAVATIAVKAVAFGLYWTAIYLIFTVLYHRFRIHERFGFFGVAEPEIHFRTALRNWKVPFLWGVGLKLTTMAFGLDLMKLTVAENPPISLRLPNDYVFVPLPDVGTPLYYAAILLYAVIGFYMIDLADWSAHWINHRFDVLYKKFPVGHFVHHNYVWVNPTTVVGSPIVHLAQLTGIILYALFLTQGLVASVFLIHIVKATSNFTSHLGCDPMPWLTRLNHRLGGWIPWIPLHHQYHHLPFVPQGNYGNVTCLWDYVFGTLVPECAVHIETGRPTPEVAARVNAAEAEMAVFLKGKTAFDMP